jgi:hypothetical protein
MEIDGFVVVSGTLKVCTDIPGHVSCTGVRCKNWGYFTVSCVGVDTVSRFGAELVL